MGGGVGEGLGEGIGAGAGFVSGDNVRVNGVVRTFNLLDFGREFGYDLGDTIHGEWEGRAVLIATEVMPAVAEDGAAGVGY